MIYNNVKSFDVDTISYTIGYINAKLVLKLICITKKKKKQFKTKSEKSSCWRGFDPREKLW
jgi:hypothetical protein